MSQALPRVDGIEYTSVKWVDESVEKAFEAYREREKNIEEHVKMTWRDRGQAYGRIGMRPGKGAVGDEGFDKKLPWASLEGIYFVQNCKVFLSNGKQIPIEMIPDAPRPGRTFSDRKYVQRMLDQYKEAAISTDPMLCRYCFVYTASNPDDYANHKFKAHPGEMAKELGMEVVKPGAKGDLSGESASHHRDDAPSSLPSEPPSFSVPFISHPIGPIPGMEQPVVTISSTATTSYDYPANVGTQTSAVPHFSEAAKYTETPTMPRPIPVVDPGVKVKTSNRKPTAPIAAADGAQYLCADCGRGFDKVSSIKRHCTTKNHRRV